MRIKEMAINIIAKIIRIIVLSTLAFLVISIIILNIFPLIFFKSPVTESKETKFDVIIVLGFPAAKDGKASPIMRERVIKAVELYKEGYSGNIICSGGGVNNNYVEANVMADFAESLGVPNDCLIKESKSLDTYENIRNSVNIMKNRKWSSAIVVTSPWHLRRTNYYLSKSGISYVLKESDNPEELSGLYITALNEWENYFMIRTKFTGR